MNGIVIAIAIMVVAVGAGLTYISLRRAFSQATAELRMETERQLNTLATALKILQTQVGELSAAVASAAPLVSPAPARVATPVPAIAAIPRTEEVSPEIMVVIAAAVATFLGKKVRIRSAKALQSPYETVNPWSQQGRVFVQASHNLRSK